MKTLKTILEERIEFLQKSVDEYKSKLMDNFIFNYSWGYADNIISCEHKINGLKGLLYYIDNGEKPIAEWLEFNIKMIEKDIFSGNFTQNSTSSASNQAFAIKKKTDCELREMYIEFLEEINNTKDHLQIK